MIAPSGVLSLDAYQALINAQSRPLSSLSHEFDDLLASMQAPAAARDAMMDAFDASPDDMGHAAWPQLQDETFPGMGHN